jgi:hypothetical protein
MELGIKMSYGCIFVRWGVRNRLRQIWVYTHRASHYHNPIGMVLIGVDLIRCD